eukprot:7565712-Pyramimonas_sp.AAC.1
MIGTGAVGQVDETAPASPPRFELRARVEFGTRSSLDDPGAMGGPPPQAIRRRATLELRSRKAMA